MAIALLTDAAHRPVRVNEDGTVNLSASLVGKGGTKT